MKVQTDPLCLKVFAKIFGILQPLLYIHVTYSRDTIQYRTAMYYITHWILLYPVTTKCEHASLTEFTTIIQGNDQIHKIRNDGK